jgi:hypothetical protein
MTTPQTFRANVIAPNGGPVTCSLTGQHRQQVMVELRANRTTQRAVLSVQDAERLCAGRGVQVPTVGQVVRTK